MICDKEEMILLEGSDDGRSEESTMRTGGARICSCPSCALYRWYPPLLVASTLLAAVFCTLYLTKPVRTMAPAQGAEPAAIEQGAEIPTMEVELSDSGGQIVGVSDEALDPMQGGLPGDPRGEQSLETPQRPDTEESVARTTGLKRLQISKPARSLFEPAPSPTAQELASEAPEPIKVQRVEKPMEQALVFGIEPSARHQSGLMTDLGVEEGGGTDWIGQRITHRPSGLGPVALAERGVKWDKEQNRLHPTPVKTPASIVGEFYSPAQPVSDPSLDVPLAGSSS